MHHKNSKFSSGYSMVEILVVLAVVGLMGLGTTSMVSNMLKLGRKNEMNAGIRSFKANLETMLRNDDSWTNTIKATGAAAGNQLSCLWDGDDTECNNGAVINNFNVHERAPAPAATVAPPGPAVPIFYPAGTPTAGFTIQGEPCNTYNGGGGNDNCPLRYDLSATLNCPTGQTACLKPTVTITGTLRIRPSTDRSLANRVNIQEFNFSIVKTNEVRFEPLEVRHRVPNVDPDDDGIGTGAGACTPGVPVARPLNEIAYDVGGNIVGPVAGTSFTLRAGVYNCEVTASAYEALNGFKIFLRENGTSHPAGSGFSGVNSTATSVAKVDFSLAANSVISIMHECTSNGPTDSQYDMGIPARNNGAVPFYTGSGGTTFTQVTCIRSR